MLYNTQEKRIRSQHHYESTYKEPVATDDSDTSQDCGYAPTRQYGSTIKK